MFGLGDTIDDITGKARSSDKRGKSFKRGLGFDFHNDSETTAGGVMQNGTENPLVRFRVPAGREYHWGYGAARYEANQGYMKGHIVDEDGDDVKGTLTLEQHSSTGRTQIKVMDIPADDLPAADDGDRSTKEPLPEQDDFALVTQDSWLVVTFKPDESEYPDGSVEIDPEASELYLPVTEYDLTA